MSGRGSTAQSALELLDTVPVALVVSSRETAYALKRARRLGVPTLVLEKKIDWESVSRELHRRKINRVFLLGFMKIIPEKFVNDWAGKIFNIHPSLLPEFPGAHGMQESFSSDTAAMGITVHRVTAALDQGPHLLQRRVLSPDLKFKMNWENVQLRMSVNEQLLIRRVLVAGVRG